MAAPSGSRTRRIPPHLWLRLGLFAALLGAGLVLARFTPLGTLLDEQTLMTVLGDLRGLWWSPLLLLGLYVVLAPLGLPMAPLLVGGAVFGAVRGSVYNTVGLLLGAALSYLLARALGRDFVTRVTGDRLRRAERALERHGFWPLVQTRFLPLPFPVVNFGAALAGVEVGRFVAASFLGLVPSTVIHTTFISTLMATHGSQRALVGAGYAAAFILFNALLGGWWFTAGRRRRRDQEPLVRPATTGGTAPVATKSGRASP